MNNNGILKAPLLPAAVIISLCICTVALIKFADKANSQVVTQRFAVPAAASQPPSNSEADLRETFTQKAKVKLGDNLGALFTRYGLSTQDLQRLLEAQPLGPQLTQIFPGHEFVFQIGDNNDLLGLTYSSGPLRKLEFTRMGNRFEAVELVAEPDVKLVHKYGAIDHSLFVASQRAGLPDRSTMQLADMFRWDIDFVLDIRTGDVFHLLIEEKYLDGKSIGFGRILAAEFINQGQIHKAVLYQDPDGREVYVDPTGRAMRKQFLRTPVEFTRISSQFNLRRRHPLFKHTAPHRGIDYAAPEGTPVRAAGDGVVEVAGKTRPNGNYVVLRHDNAFTTKYLHLSKFRRDIKAGARVRQGDTIGYVGSSGWATGPHLHYEFLVNGVHQNPRTVELPRAEAIGAQNIEHFRQSTAPLLAMLAEHEKRLGLVVGR